MIILTLGITVYPEYSLAGNTGLFTYHIGQESIVSIHGTTNVNSFKCVSDGNIQGGYLVTDHFPGEQLILFSDAGLDLEIRSFDCRNRMMNKDFRQALGGEEYPFIKISLLETRIEKGVGGEEKRLIATVQVRIKEESVKKEVAVELSKQGNMNFFAEGGAHLRMSDFGIEPPSPALGIIRVDDEIEVRFRLSVEANMITGSF